MTNYFRIENRVFLILRQYRQRGVIMLEGIGFDGLSVTVPINGVQFMKKAA